MITSSYYSACKYRTHDFPFYVYEYDHNTVNHVNHTFSCRATCLPGSSRDNHLTARRKTKRPDPSVPSFPCLHMPQTAAATLGAKTCLNSTQPVLLPKLRRLLARSCALLPRRAQPSAARDNAFRPWCHAPPPPPAPAIHTEKPGRNIPERRIGKATLNQARHRRHRQQRQHQQHRHHSVLLYVVIKQQVYAASLQSTTVSK